MNMIEALKLIKADGSLWARPVSWHHCGTAITPSNDGRSWLTVPDHRGGRSTALPSPADCFGEWEVVTPEIVNTER